MDRMRHDSTIGSRLLRDGRTQIGLAVVILMVVAAISAPVIARHDPNKIDLVNLLTRPSSTHWLGTDVEGRDVWARLVYGARISLAVGVISQSIALALGVTLGLVSGF